MPALHRAAIAAMIILAVGCDSDNDKSIPKVPPTLTISQSTAIFYNPSGTYDDSLRKSLGDAYFRLRDSLTSNNNLLIHLFDSLRIDYRYTSSDIVAFEEGKGRTTLLEIKKLNAPWGVIYFEKGMPPILLYGNTKNIIKLLGTVIPGFRLQPAPPVIVGNEPGSYETKEMKPSTEGQDLQKPREALLISTMDAIEDARLPLASADSILREDARETRIAFTNRINQQPLLLIKFDNDIFANTDIYYTNGVRIEHIAPIWQHSPLSALLISPGKKGETSFGMSLVQNMYTPQYPVLEEIQYGDRPFASYLFFSNFLIYNNPEKQNRLTSELAVGVIGPASLGGSIQSYLHGEEKRPRGWKNQIANDLIVNYNLQFEKGIFGNANHDVVLIAGLAAGTLYTTAESGIKYNWGNRSSYFTAFYNLPAHFSPRQPWWSYFSYDLFAQTNLKGIAYDATLQGGIFNHSSPYTLNNSDIHRVIWSAEVGLSIAYKRYSAAFIQHIASPEFRDARWHKWGRIKVTIPL